MVNVRGHNAEPHARLNAVHRTASLLVLSLGATILVYVGIGYLITSQGEPKLGETQVPVPFYVGAVFLALGSIAYRRTQMHRFRLESIALRRGLDGLITHFFNVTLISAALAEMIGVLGLMTVFFGGDTWDVLRLAVVALAIMLYSYPRRAAWQQAVDYFSATLPK